MTGRAERAPTHVDAAQHLDARLDVVGQQRERLRRGRAAVGSVVVVVVRHALPRARKEGAGG